ncbi:Intraflagellar transport protein 88 [Gonapodya sp. JEL0774]|nr:Intraflagellar transport protein 88 [Gonapodya sp. JEL0774]
MFNLGLAYKTAGELDEAVRWFTKLHAVLKNAPEVIWHVADIYEKLGNVPLALEWYNILISVSPTDPTALCSLARLHEHRGDLAQAHHYYSESHRYHPTDPDVASWLGARFIDQGAYEQAEGCFRKAAVARPDEVRWALAVAGCRRMGGNLASAREAYDVVAERWPDNAECLRFLVRLCTDMGLNKDSQLYTERLARLEASGTSAESSKPALETNSAIGGERRGIKDAANRRASVAESKFSGERGALMCACELGLEPVPTGQYGGAVAVPSPRRVSMPASATAAPEADDTFDAVDQLLPG